MPRLLSPTDVSTFRDRLCQAAERLFADQGPSAVTMRQLAVELGCSPMTPYRYFKDKEEILATVRAAAFDRLAGALEAAVAEARGGGLSGVCRAVGRAYVAFVRAEPHAYRLMFDLNQPSEEAYPALAEASGRAREALTGHLLAADRGRHDPEEMRGLGDAQWASIHGALMLHLAGKLPPNLELGQFVDGLLDRLCRSLSSVEEKLLVGGF